MSDGRAFADRLAADLASILGGNLIGVYLHGSLAIGCFNPARSDVDLLVVTRERMPVDLRNAVLELLLSRSSDPYPIEITFLAEVQLRPWRYPTPYDFHYGESHRDSGGVVGADGDHDLAGHIGLLRARGETLTGAPIQEVFPEVPQADFLDSIVRDLEWIQQPTTRMGGRVYGVLNACRVVAYVRGAGILSKAEAGEWALRELPAEQVSVVSAALAAYRSGGDEPLDPDEARRTVDAIAALV